LGRSGWGSENLNWVDRTYLQQAVAIALAANLNLFVFYGVDGQDFPFNRVVGVDIALILSVLYVILFLIIYFPVINRGMRSSA